MPIVTFAPRSSLRPGLVNQVFQRRLSSTIVVENEVVTVIRDINRIGFL